MKEVSNRVFIESPGRTNEIGFWLLFEPLSHVYSQPSLSQTLCAFPNTNPTLRLLQETLMALQQFLLQFKLIPSEHRPKNNLQLHHRDILPYTSSWPIRKRVKCLFLSFIQPPPSMGLEIFNIVNPNLCHMVDSI